MFFTGLRDYWLGHWRICTFIRERLSCLLQYVDNYPFVQQKHCILSFAAIVWIWDFVHFRTHSTTSIFISTTWLNCETAFTKSERLIISRWYSEGSLFWRKSHMIHRLPLLDWLAAAITTSSMWKLWGKLGLTAWVDGQLHVYSDANPNRVTDCSCQPELSPYSLKLVIKIKLEPKSVC